MAKTDDHEIWKSFYKRLQAFLREAGTGGELATVKTGMADLDEWLKTQLQLQVEGKLRNAHQRLLGQLGKLPERATPSLALSSPASEPDYSAYFLEDPDDRPRRRGRPRKRPAPGEANFVPAVFSAYRSSANPLPPGSDQPPRVLPPPVTTALLSGSEYQLSPQERSLLLRELLPWLSAERQLPDPSICRLELAHWKLPEIIQQTPLPWPYATEPELYRWFSELRQSGELRKWPAFTLVRLQVPLEEAPLWTADWEYGLLDAARQLQQAEPPDFWQHLSRKHSPTAKWWRDTKKKAWLNQLDPLQAAWLQHLQAPFTVRAKRKRGRLMSDERFHSLLSRIREFYATNPPDALPYQDKKLFNYIYRVRKAWKKNRLDASTQSALEGAGLVFNLDQVPNRFFMVHYQKLAAFHARYGHCRLPVDYPEARNLINWVWRQRIRRKKNRMNAAEIALLDKLGFDWQPGSRPIRLSVWYRNLATLQNYLRDKGLTTLPKLDSELGPFWMRWLTLCRRYYRQNLLPADIISSLDQLGMRWTSADRKDPQHPKTLDQEENRSSKQRKRWMQWFERWKAWKESDPRGYGGERTLPRWCVKQRVRRKQGTLPQECIRLLDEHGFNWDPFEQPREAWMFHYRHLVNFIRQHGHMIIKRDGIPEDPGLGEWIAQVRRRRKMGRLSAEHIRLLDEIGFAWKGPDPQVSRRFGRPYLEASNATPGHP